MVLGSQNRQYRTMQEVYHGKKNDVVVCQDLQAAGTLCRTVWIVKDRALVRSIIQMFRKADCSYETCFGYEGGMCFVFPYEQERSLDKFYLVTTESGACSRGQIWTRLVMKCMAGGLPAPILYLILKGRQLRLGEDGNISFLYNLDLEKLDVEKNEADCAAECARLLRELMEQEPGKHTAGELLERRLRRQSYKNFIDLYKDIQLIAKDADKKRDRKRLASILAGKRDVLFRTVLILSVILLVVTVVLLLGRLVFGEATIFQLFRHAIERIGTESLLQ
jgi:hypothetical protein